MADSYRNSLTKVKEWVRMTNCHVQLLGGHVFILPAIDTAPHIVADIFGQKCHDDLDLMAPMVHPIAIDANDDHHW